MIIQVLGTGCPKCTQLTQNVGEAVRNLGLDAVVEKVTDIQKIVACGVMITPALVVDGKVESSGKLLSVTELESLLKAKAAATCR